MRWFWQRREARQALPFTDALADAIVAQAAGTTAGDPRAIAALECCAGLWSRAFAAADVEPAHPAITPAALALIARDLIRRGESVFAIEVDGAAPVLVPAGSWDVRGGWREADWHYRIDLFGPSGNVTRFVPAGAVVHARYAIDPARPWFGLSPLEWARHTGALAANLELRLSEEASGAVSRLIPIPQDGGDGGDDDPLAGLKADIAAGKGRALLVETVNSGWGDGKTAAPQRDWAQSRIGADPPAPLISLREDAGMAVMSACGVQAALLGARTDGTAMREAWRQFVMGAVEPVARMVALELSRKLDVPGLRFNFASLWAHDLAGRASELQSDGHGGHGYLAGRRAGGPDGGRGRVNPVLAETGIHSRSAQVDLIDFAGDRVTTRGIISRLAQTGAQLRGRLRQGRVAGVDTDPGPPGPDRIRRSDQPAFRPQALARARPRSHEGRPLVDVPAATRGGLT